MRQYVPVILATTLLTLVSIYPWMFGTTWGQARWQFLAPFAWGTLVVFPLLARSTRPDERGNRILVSDPASILQRILFVASVVIGTALANDLLLHSRGESNEARYDALDILVTLLMVIYLLAWRDRKPAREPLAKP
jgi:hypothetical protein